MNNPKIAIVIVTWNKKDDVLNLLNSLKGISYTNHDIFVVDNASEDGSVEAIQENFPGAELIINEENLGGTGGFNTGIRRVSGEGKYKYIWLLDNDAEVSKSTLEELVKAMENNSSIGIAGSRIMSPEKRDLIVEIGGTVDWSSGTWMPNYRYVNEADYKGNNVLETDYVAACSALVRAEVLEKTGSMDERFFLHWDDIDFSLKISESGYRVVSVFSSVVYHSVEKGFNPGVLYYDYRNGLLATSKHLNGFKKFVSTINILRQSNKAMIYFFLEKKYTWAKLMFRALYDFCVNDFGRAGVNFNKSYSKELDSKTYIDDIKIESAKRVLVFPNGTQEDIEHAINNLKHISPQTSLEILIPNERLNMIKELPVSKFIEFDMHKSSFLKKVSIMLKIILSNYDMGLSVSGETNHPFVYCVRQNIIYDKEKNSYYLSEYNIKKIWVLAVSVIIGDFLGLLLSPLFYLRQLSYRVK